MSLAILLLNNHASSSCIAEGLGILKKLFVDGHAQDARVLLHFANHYFFKKDYAKAAQFASSAAAATSDGQLASEINFVLAKIFHAREDWDKALAYYSKSQHSIPSAFGLAQILAKNSTSSLDCVGSYASAFSALEAIRSSFRDLSMVSSTRDV